MGIIAESSEPCLKDHSLIRGPVLWQGRSLTEIYLSSKEAPKPFADRNLSLNMSSDRG